MPPRCVRASSLQIKIQALQPALPHEPFSGTDIVFEIIKDARSADSGPGNRYLQGSVRRQAAFMSCIRFRRPLPHGIMTSQENQAVAVSYMPARELHLRVPKAASASPAAAGKSQSGPLTLPGQEWQNSNPGQQTAEAHLPIWTRNWFCPSVPTRPGTPGPRMAYRYCQPARGWQGSVSSHRWIVDSTVSSALSSGLYMSVR